MGDGTWSRFFAAVDEELAGAVDLRRRLHRAPAVSGAEGPTLDAVIEALGVADWQPIAETGALVRIGPATGPAIGIRAELDALPIVERTGSPYASENGAMHACGHDIHISAAVAIGRAALRVPLPVALLLILQPREEAYPSGARDICESELFHTHELGQVFGAHVHPRIPAGGIAIGAGAVNAAADEFNIEIDGHGGHAAYPHHARDPIVALGAVIGALQTLVSRRLDPMHPAVLTFGTVTAGSAANVIPDRAYASGSLRTMDTDDRVRLHDEVGAMVSAIAHAHGCTGTVRITKGEPILFNDPDLSHAVQTAFDRAGVVTVDPMRSCGADDFSFYSEQFPGVMMFVGVGDGPDTPALHSATFMPPDSAIADIARAYALAIQAVVQLESEG
ncbi:amidohydrolase [Leucobacter rhizosphaerae]|uniref:Amidohydrolase n=1 Tax=Leucobacter rhizosphaerae TaxID=2932245 RepID=A0ABY4FZ40_9MICO|nr:amidohydrolase [Leucobacter rhizosphaerae]UOQ61575.1 amidohydrolase [Leucobacter rhizosphaerae]